MPTSGPPTLLGSLQLPIVQAPLSGGASTPKLTIAASRAGAFGILAAGYLTADRLREDIRQVRNSTGAPFGVNLFVPGRESAETVGWQSYMERIRLKRPPSEPK